MFIDIDLFVMSYFLKLWFKVQFVEWEKYNQENLVNLVKNLQETACVEVRLHTQYFDKNWKIQKNMKDRLCIGNGIPSIFVFMNDCGADSDNKQVMGIKTISLYDFI